MDFFVFEFLVFVNVGVYVNVMEMLVYEEIDK